MKNLNLILLLLLSVYILSSCNNDDDDKGPTAAVLDSQGREISSNDNFPRKTIQVGTSSSEFMSYIDEGAGDPIIFLHGAPSYNYLWRNVIPYLSDNARVIAIDWMGSGNSGFSPNGDYSYLKQLEYLESFINQLELTNITFVMHDWSTITALTYAHQNQTKVKAIATFEAVYFPIPDASSMPPLAQQFIGPDGERIIVDENAFMNIMLPNFVVRNLTAIETANYKRRWLVKNNRFALLGIPKGLPINGQPVDLWNQFGAASTWFSQSSITIPKFFTHTNGGVLITDAVVDTITGASMIDIVSSFPNTTVIPIDETGSHFIQEDSPHDLGIALSNWYDSL